MKSNEIVKQWVSTRSSFYFFLSDGPYGRPFDNQYSIEKIEQTADGFSIFLSDSLVLHFIGETDIVDEGCNLLIKSFNKCIFEENNKLKNYDYGDVVLNGF